MTPSTSPRLNSTSNFTVWDGAPAGSTFNPPSVMPPPSPCSTVHITWNTGL